MDSPSAIIPRIAIVGVAGRFPGSGADLGQFWDNVRTAADCSREVPPGRWLLPPERCFDPRISNTDTVYSTRGYFLDPFEPDIDGLGLPMELVAELDPLFHLILDVGHRAWTSARTANVDRRKVGVILGNICLPSDKASDLARSFLAPIAGRPKPVHSWNRYVAGLPAGLLAKSLGLGAGHFTLDAACASSLYAIKLACDELLSGRADAMLAGGASRPDCLYTQMGFAQLRALSASGMCSPFSAKADGLVVGEGSGVFVLKRHDDAERDGDTIRAVIRGWGVSNDIAGNLLAPASDGQLRAMRDAYRMAGWQPTDVRLIECHATGTPVGDTVEFESLRELWRSHSWAPGQCVIGSVKSTVGHLLTGAGSAALAKAIFAIENRTLPPQANFSAPGGQLEYADGPFRVLNAAEEWASDVPRRAAISGFGFGGVNAHLLIEEYEPAYADAHAPIIVGGFTDRADPAPMPLEDSDPIAIVGVGAQVGPWTSAAELKAALLTSAPVPAPKPKRNGWDEAPTVCPAGYFLESIAAPLDRFRIPPREMEDMLPQQLLMLHVAAEALDDSGADDSAERGTPLNERTGVFIGLGLDLNTTNYHLRWATGDAELPALSADRTMGALGSIAASRIARAFHFGGSSFTCCSEETSAGTAIALAVRALRRGELDRAVVGGVDLAGDPRQLLATAATKTVQSLGQVQPHARFETGLLPAEGAAAVVLKRLKDAQRDGDRMYAVIRGVGTSTGGDASALATDAAAYATSFVRACADAMVDPAGIDLLDGAASGADADDRAEAEALSAVLSTTERPFPLALAASRGRVGHTGAASALVSLVGLGLALHHRILPATPGAERIAPTDELYSSRAPRYWLADCDQPRRAALAAVGADGSCVHVVLEEVASKGVAESPALLEGLFSFDGGTAGELLDKVNALASQSVTDGAGMSELARGWWHANPPHASRKLGAAVVARNAVELREQLAYLAEWIADPTVRDPVRELRAGLRDRVFYSPLPLGPMGKIAFVFPGSGNHFAGMGRDLGVAFPGILGTQQTENLRLRGQYAPEKFWAEFIAPDTTAKQFLFGQVALGTLVSDTLVSLGVKPDATIGLSLGESSSLFGLRVWTDRDEMFRRIRGSSLFDTDLAPPYDAARKCWDLDSVDWVSGVVSASADDVRSHLRPGLRAYLLIVNTPMECVIGGQRADVEALATSLGKTLLPLSGVTLAHCEAGKPVEVAYRNLHTLPTTAIPGLQIFSGAWARPYAATSANAADSITAGLLNTLDFPVLLDAAYREGVRVFIEVGPGNSCTRMIGSALAGRAHLARAITVARQDAPSNILKLLGSLIAERYPIDLGKLYGAPPASVEPARRCITIPVGRKSRAHDMARTPSVPAPPAELVSTPKPGPTPPPVKPRPSVPFVAVPSPVQTPPPRFAIPGWADATSPVLAASSTAQSAVAEAHDAFLRVQHGLTQTTIATLQLQSELIRRLLGDDDVIAIPVAVDPMAVPRSLSFEQCTEYAVGRIGRVLGPLFAEIDDYPTRVRLPEGPLMLVDRVLTIEGEPKSMTRGRVVTDHTVRGDRWYLDNGRCPTSITVEAGQADLFLSGFLGIDLETKGLAVYRLLDAVVTFHRELPRVGERIEYDIRIDEFFRQADSWLFRFRFEGTIDGEPLLSMANGVAGFFTAKALAAGQGIIHTKLDRQPMAGKRPADWEQLVPFEKCSLDAEQVASLRAGDLARAFGQHFAKLPLANPMKLPSGMLRLVDFVPVLDPTGGRFGLGFVRAEYIIQSPEWFIECHFIDDKVMPGTLMYECCLHTLRILLMRMGWVGEEGAVTCEPVPGIQSRLKCRGQVLDTTQLVTYEVSVRELGFRPEPYCIADALMYADGKPIVEITNLSLRMSGLSLAALRGVWGLGSRVWQEASSARPNTPDPRPAYLYAPDKIMAYSNGKPSEGFGEPYRIFDEGRVIARLPGPPYQFLDGITAVTGEPFVLKDGASCEALYAVPEDAWYFAANRCDRMPFSILLEIALQPCGWLAAYCGSALTSASDLSFRNLGGQGTQFELVGSDIGTLTTRVTMTKVSNSAGMIIQHFDLLVLAGERKVYEGTTYFGFFAKAALVNQVGMTQAKVPYLTPEQLAVGGVLPHEPPFPAPMLRMVDRIDGYLPDGGAKGLGLLQGRIAVDPEFWFFKAHFFQDPVWPGSLGVESFLQLLKYAAWKRWGEPPVGGWQTVAPNRKHAWSYRGQVLPTDREVVVVLEVTSADDALRTLTADGFLTVDGRVIYQMTGFALE